MKQGKCLIALKIVLLFLFLTPLFAKAQIVENDIKAFVCSWFGASDRKASHEFYLPLMADDIEMYLPSDTLNSKQDFIDWRKHFSGRFEWNQHDLSSIDVCYIADNIWNVNIDINWRALTTTGDKLAKKIHQNWYIEATSSGLLLKKRIVKIIGDGSIDGRFPTELSDYNLNMIKQFIYEWFAGVNKQKPREFFEKKNHPFLGIDTDYGNKKYLFQHWYYEIYENNNSWHNSEISAIHLEENFDDISTQWDAYFDVVELIKGNNDTFYQKKYHCKMTLIVYSSTLEILLWRCTFSSIK